MKKRIVIPSLLIGALLTGGLALAGSYGNGPGNCGGDRFGSMSAEEQQERREHKLEMMSEVLDLTEEQEVQVGALLEKQWTAKQQQREQRLSDKEEMREKLTSDDFNETEFRAQAMKKAEQKIDRMVEHAKTKQQIYQLLTPEQQEKADKLMALRGKSGKGHHGRHGMDF